MLVLIGDKKQIYMSAAYLPYCKTGMIKTDVEGMPIRLPVLREGTAVFVGFESRAGEAVYRCDGLEDMQCAYKDRHDPCSQIARLQWYTGIISKIKLNPE